MEDDKLSAARTPVTEVHEQREFIEVAVYIPGHEPRGNASALFERSRKKLIARDKVCWICGCTGEQTGHPLEAHHHPVERSFAEMIDWGPNSQIRRDHPTFNWASFDPKDPYTFVDDMEHNGRLLCKAHHVGKDEGIHMLPHPIWLAQRYGREGYKFSDVEVIHHVQE